MQRRLFQFSCPHCQNAMDCEYDTLYHDPKESVMVWLKHPEENDVMTMRGEPLGLVEQILKGYQLRLVTTFGALLEKIYCFDNDFDDRVIELLKATVYQQLNGIALDHDVPFYFAGLERSTKPELNFVSARSAGEQWYHLPLSPYYDIAAQQFRQICRTPAPTNEWLLVNRRYLDTLSES